jgi:DNA-binding NarL/FixJ family response regulator
LQCAEKVLTISAGEANVDSDGAKGFFRQARLDKAGLFFFIGIHRVLIAIQYGQRPIFQMNGSIMEVPKINWGYVLFTYLIVLMNWQKPRLFGVAKFKMILYLLSTCPVFLEGYAFALSKKIRNITWKSFTDPVSALNEDLSMPSAFLIKPVGLGNTNTIIGTIRSRYPSASIIGVIPPDENQSDTKTVFPFDFVILANDQLDKVIPEILDCLPQVKNGHATINESLDTELFSIFDKYKYLNKRDADLFRALSIGNTVKEIGNDLGIPYRTLEGHVAKLKKHFGISRKSEFKNLASALVLIGYK